MAALRSQQPAHSHEEHDDHEEHRPHENQKRSSFTQKGSLRSGRRQAQFGAADFSSLHLKDRKANQGANVRWGEGDTPIEEVLQLLKKNRYDIPANIEYEYRGEDAVAEVRTCLEYCRQALA